MNDANNDAYWKANIKLMLILLSIWFLVSFVFGILLVDTLNQIQFFGFKLGFWWAQQGAIYVFIILIFTYTIMMQRIDRRYGVSDDDTEAETAQKEQEEEERNRRQSGVGAPDWLSFQFSHKGRNSKRPGRFADFLFELRSLCVLLGAFGCFFV